MKLYPFINPCRNWKAIFNIATSSFIFRIPLLKPRIIYMLKSWRTWFWNPQYWPFEFHTKVKNFGKYWWNLSFLVGTVALPLLVLREKVSYWYWHINMLIKHKFLYIVPIAMLCQFDAVFYNLALTLRYLKYSPIYIFVPTNEYYWSIYLLMHLLIVLVLEGVDTSLPALELANENIILNDLDPQKISFVKKDATEFMKNAILRNDSWDIVILDPPKLAPSKKV